MGDNNNLPPGFRFCPTDEELVVHFLRRKDDLLPYHPDIIPDLDVYPYNPWDLQGNFTLLFSTYILNVSSTSILITYVVYISLISSNKNKYIFSLYVLFS